MLSVAGCDRYLVTSTNCQSPKKRGCFLSVKTLTGLEDPETHTVYTPILIMTAQAYIFTRISNGTRAKR